MSTREDAERRYAQIEGERDYHKRRAERLEEGRDALLAQVERYHAAYVKLTNSEPIEDADTRETMYLATQSLMAEFDAIAESQPTTSLYQRKAQWQAEALETVVAEYRGRMADPSLLCIIDAGILEGRAAELRHSVEPRS